MSEYTLAVRRIGLVGIANLLVNFSSIILLPILTKTLPVADYGTWSLIMVTITLVPLLATLGLPYAMLRFLAGSHNRQDIQEVFYSIGFVILATSLVASGVFLLFARQIAISLFQGDLTSSFLFSVNIFLACLNVFLSNYFRTFQQAKKYSALIILQASLNIGYVAFFVLSGHGLQGAVVGLFLQQFSIFCVMGYMILREIGVVIPKFVDTKKHLSFGLPLVPSYLSSWAVNSSDRYLIGILLGTVAVGYYSPGYSLGSLIYMFAVPLMMMLPPILSKHYDAKEIVQVQVILAFSLKYYLGIAIPSAFVLSILSKPLLEIFSTSQIAANGYLVTPFVAISWLLIGAYEIIILPLILKKRTAFFAAVWIVSALINIGLNLMLIPYIGIVGAALATLLAFLCAFVLAALYSFKDFKFDLNGPFVVKSICASIIASLPLFFWKSGGLSIILLSVSFYAAIYLGIIYALRGFTIEEVRSLYNTLVHS